MTFIHETLSVVEWIALGVFGLVVLAVLGAVLTNLSGLKRYLHIRSM